MKRDHSRDEEIVSKLRMICRAWGGKRQFALMHNFSSAYISIVINGQQPPSQRLTEAVDCAISCEETYYG